MAYRDSSTAIRERVAELERDRRGIDRELAALRVQLSALSDTRFSERVHFVSLLIGQAAPFLLLLAALGLVGGAVVVVTVSDWFDDPSACDEGPNLRMIGAAVDRYRVRHDDCPSVEMLVAAGALDEEVGSRDAWFGEYAVECSDGRRIVRSAGPDGVHETGDDIESVRIEDRCIADPPSCLPPDDAAPSCPGCAPPASWRISP